MTERYLITQSLLSAFNYIFDCYEGGEQSAYEDFLKVLNREQTETNEAMQRGIDFENKVLKYTKLSSALAPKGNVPADFDDTAFEIATVVQGSQWQVKAYKDKQIDGINFLLYAKCDCVKAGEVFDIKRSDSYEVGKYQNSAQHPMYFECVPAHRFAYLISDGKHVYQEAYLREETPSIDGTIRNFIDFLRNENLFETYCEKWRAS